MRRRVARPRERLVVGRERATMVKTTTKLAALIGVALVDPVSAAGMKFGEDDVKSEKTLWRLYQRWQAHFNVTRRDVSIAVL